MIDSYPLYLFFQSLRTRGATLGVDDYELMLEALQKGWGIESKEQLYSLCKLLWLKPQFSELQFEEAFMEYFAHISVEESLEKEPVDTSDNKLEEEHTEAPKDPFQDTEPQKETDELQRPRRRRAKQDRQQVLREVEVAIGMQEEHSFDLKTRMKLEGPDFTFFPHHLPMLPRQINQSWRFLRQLYPEGITEQINVRETVKHIAEKGYLENPVFEQDQVNKVKLTVFIDEEGSMVPFQQEVEVLLSLIKEDLGKGYESFYFYNLPYDGLLFHNPAHTTATRLQEWKKSMIQERGKFAMLLISDAGAARGFTDMERIEETQQFLSQCYLLTQKIAWLNPVPMWRWKGSSAEHIAKLVPMYDFTEIGLQHIVNVLRGKDAS